MKNVVLFAAVMFAGTHGYAAAGLTHIQTVADCGTIMHNVAVEDDFIWLASYKGMGTTYSPGNGEVGDAGHCRIVYGTRDKDTGMVGALSSYELDVDLGHQEFFDIASVSFGCLYVRDFKGSNAPIIRYSYNASTGRPTKIDTTATTGNGAIYINPRETHLYYVDFNSNPARILTYSIHTTTGALTLENTYTVNGVGGIAISGWNDCERATMSPDGRSIGIFDAADGVAALIRLGTNGLPASTSLSTIIYASPFDVTYLRYYCVATTNNGIYACASYWYPNESPYPNYDSNHYIPFDTNGVLRTPVNIASNNIHYFLGARGTPDGEWLLPMCDDKTQGYVENRIEPWAFPRNPETGVLSAGTGFNSIAAGVRGLELSPASKYLSFVTYHYQGRADLHAFRTGYTPPTDVAALATSPAAPFSITQSAIESEPTATASFEIFNSGALGLDWSITGDDAAWISVSPKNGSSAGAIDRTTITVSLNGTGQPVNSTLTATLVIEGIKQSDLTSAVNSPISVAGTFHFNEDPPAQIAVSPTSLLITAYDSLPSPTAALTLTNPGYVALNWTASDTAAWLTLTPSSGSVIGAQTGSNDSNTVSCAVDATALSHGTYSAIITLTDPNASNSPVTVPVDLTVAPDPDPELLFNSTHLTITVTDALPTGMAMLQVSNAGFQSIDWTLTSSDSWLTATPTNGTCASRMAPPITVAVVGTATAGPGEYYGVLTFTATGGVSEIYTVDVTLILPPKKSKTKTGCALQIVHESGGRRFGCAVFIIGFIAAIKRRMRR